MCFEGFLELNFFSMTFGVEYLGFYAECLLGDNGGFMGCTGLSFSPVV